MAQLCAFLIAGGVLYDSHLGLSFRNKLQNAGAFYIYEMEDEWLNRMRIGRTCDKLKCEASRQSAIAKLSYRDVIILRAPIKKEQLALFGC